MNKLFKLSLAAVSIFSLTNAMQETRHEVMLKRMLARQTPEEREYQYFLDHITPEQNKMMRDLRALNHASTPEQVSAALKRDSALLKTPIAYELLYAAVQFGTLEDITLLLEKGASVKSSPRYDSALAAAVHRGDLSIIRLLLEKGVDINHQDRNGNTVLHFVKFHIKHTANEQERAKYEEIEKLLKETGAREDIVNAAGDTPEQAAQKVTPEKELVEYGPHEAPEKFEKLV